MTIWGRVPLYHLEFMNALLNFRDIILPKPCRGLMCSRRADAVQCGRHTAR